MWHCVTCLASTARLDAAIKSMEIRLSNVETRLLASDDRAKLTDVRLDRVELVAEQAKAEVQGAKEDVANVIFEEMRDREEKRLNIVLHNVGEAGRVSVEEARKWDEDSFNNVAKAMSVPARYANCTTFSRRLGAGGGDRPRPLLVGLRSEEDKAMILNGARNLATTGLRTVSVVPDLTKRQREHDDKIRKEADRRNREELTEEERAKNVRWVAVGRKGARKVVRREQAHGHPSYPAAMPQYGKRGREQQEQATVTNNKRARGDTVGEGEGEMEAETEAETTLTGERDKEVAEEDSLFY